MDNQTSDRDLEAKRAIGRRLRARRDDLGLTPAEVAERLSVPRPTYAQYETGRADISATMLLRVAAALEVQVAYFFGETLVADADGRSLAVDEQLRRLADRMERLEQAIRNAR